MAQEECGELVAAVAQYERDRVPGSDVVEECADVIITALQAGFICGGGQGCDFDPDDLIDALAAKTARLRLRIGGGR
jgi:NTP pyrophosphatase (non-canonical NTP hydrolase)